jgi:hypothetical protein
MLAVTAPMSAHADGAGYKGTCRISSLNDTSPDGTLGGQNVWNGQVDILVVANDAGSISANCSLKVNGVSQGVILNAGNGTGFVAAADRVTFTAAVTDTVTICTNVTTSAGAESQCADLTTTPICPVQVCGDGGALDQVIAILDGVLTTVDGVINTVNEATKIVDPAVCAALIAIAPTVDGLPTAAVLYIDPTGDTYVGGTTPADLFWNCPPYTTP